MNLQIQISLISLCTIFFLSETANAALKVVADQGGSSALPYFESLNPDQTVDPGGAQIPPAPSKRYSEADMLPVSSPSLVPGKVESRALQAPMMQPLFLIGDDPLSRQWLTVRGDILRSIGAVGIVVNVENAAQLADLRRLAHGLQLSPASGEDLASRLKLDHYPVLLTATSLEQ